MRKTQEDTKHKIVEVSPMSIITAWEKATRRNYACMTTYLPNWIIQLIMMSMYQKFWDQCCLLFSMHRLGSVEYLLTNTFYRSRVVAMTVFSEPWLAEKQ